MRGAQDQAVGVAAAQPHRARIGAAAPGRGDGVVELSRHGLPPFTLVPLATCCPGVPVSARDVTDSGPAGAARHGTRQGRKQDVMT